MSGRARLSWSMSDLLTAVNDKFSDVKFIRFRSVDMSERLIHPDKFNVVNSVRGCSADMSERLIHPDKFSVVKFIRYRSADMSERCLGDNILIGFAQTIV